MILSHCSHLRRIPDLNGATPRVVRTQNLEKTGVGRRRFPQSLLSVGIAAFEREPRTG